MSKNSMLIEVNGKQYKRIPVNTKILTAKDNMLDIIRLKTKSIIQEKDIISISESPLAITQGRAVPVKDIKVSILANVLWRFVSKVEYGIGLRSPTSMQCAIDEVGNCRMLCAAFIGGLARLIGRRGKGDFYRIAGKQAALIDAATTSPVPPYENCVIKGPKDPEIEAQKIKDSLGNECAVMDINDIGGCWMVGSSNGINKKFMEQVMKDNPQGQGAELIPICLIREVK